MTRIIDVHVRRLVISSEPWYGGEVPAGQPLAFEFPLLELLTDDGLTGYSTAYCPLGQGRAVSYALADIYGKS